DRGYGRVPAERARWGRRGAGLPGENAREERHERHRPACEGVAPRERIEQLESDAGEDDHEDETPGEHPKRFQDRRGSHAIDEPREQGSAACEHRGPISLGHHMLSFSMVDLPVARPGLGPGPRGARRWSAHRGPTHASLATPDATPAIVTRA